MTTAFLAWRAPETRGWYTIGRLRVEDDRGRADPAANGDGRSAFMFEYTGGALDAHREAGFAPLASFPDLHARYVSDELFPLFANRLLPRSRPDYGDYVEWLTVPEGRNDPIALLARSTAHRATDALELYPAPEPEPDGTVVLHFFVHGLRHFPPAAIERAERLRAGESLLLMHDFQNRHDARALMLRTAEHEATDIHALGFCPRYIARDVLDLVARTRDAGEAAGAVRVEVVRVNPPPAPVWFRVLCRLCARWPNAFRPFTDEAHRPLAAEREIALEGRGHGRSSGTSATR